MRSGLVTFLAALMLAAPFTVDAETILQNDSLEEMFDGTSSAARVIEGEMYEAVFEIPEAWLPIQMLGVRVVMVQSNSSEDPSCPPPCNNACGRFGIEVWDEGTNPSISDSCPLIGANVRYKDPGAQIFTQDSAIDPATGDVIGFEVRGDATRGNATFKDLRFSAINQVQGVTLNPIIIDTTTVRVAVRALDLQCTAGGVIGTGDHFPVLISDMDGVGRPLSNFVYGEPLLAPGFPVCSSGMPQHYAWEDFGPAFTSSQPGDFIMRLILNRDGPMTNPDMGMGDPDMGTGDPDMGTADPDMGTSSDMGTGGSDLGTGMQNNNAMNNGTGGAGLLVSSVTPSEAPNTSSTDIVIVGSGFESGAEVLLDARKIGVTETQSGRISATVPEGLEPGDYDVVVTNPGGETAILMSGFTVTMPGGAGTSSDGCCAQMPAGSRNASPGLLLLALALGGVVGMRRRSDR